MKGRGWRPGWPVRIVLSWLLGAGLAVTATGTATATVSVASAGLLGPPPAAAAATTTSPTPGLSATEHAALVHAGAYGKHPVTFLLLGEYIALTLGFGLARNAGVE